MKYFRLAVLALVLIVSGCSGQQAETPENNTEIDEPVQNETPPEQNEEDDSVEDEVDYSDFEIVDITIPRNVQMDTEFDVQITVRNEGNETGVYSEQGYFYYTGTSPSIGGGENLNLDWMNDTAEVDPGDTRTFNITRELSYLGTYTYFPASRDETGSTEANLKEIEMGEAYETSRGLEVTVNNLRLEPNPEDDGFKFGLVDLSVSNTGAESVRAPSRDDLAIVTDKYDQYAFNETGDFGQRYFGSELEPGERETGVVEFRVAEEYSMENLEGVSWVYERKEKPSGYLWNR